MEPNLASYAAWNVADYLLETGLFAKAIEECFVLLRICIRAAWSAPYKKEPAKLKDSYIWVSPMPTGDPKKAK